MLLQCINCGRTGWKKKELNDGLCPSCQEYYERYELEAENYHCFSCGAMFEEECCCDENFED